MLGLLVSVVILQQGFSLFMGAFGDLTDAGISPRTHRALTRILDPLTQSSPTSASSPYTQSVLLGIRHLRAKRAGSLVFVDLTADVAGSLSVRQTSELEAKITSTLKAARREIAEVRVQFHPVEDKPSNK
jgi:divalent metal cation (Fe/Co/Zn/Cd) transporter